MDIQINFIISSQQIANAMITALEGGSNYWISDIELHDSRKGVYAKPWYSDPDIYDDLLQFDLKAEDPDSDTGEYKTH